MQPQNYNEFKAAAPRVYVQATFDFIDKINSKREFDIISDFPPINGLACTIEKGERCFKYETSVIN